MSNTTQALSRIEAILDDSSFVEIGAAVTARATDFNMQEKKAPSDGVITGYGAPKSLGFTSETSEEKEHEDMKSKVMEEVKRIFRPEFINRIDDIIVFHMLKKEQIGQIVDIMMRTVNNRIMEQMSLSVELDDEAKAYIVDKGYDSKYGARPLRRTIQNEIEDVMAEKILEGSIKAGNKVLVTVKDGKLNFSCKRGHNRNIHK